RGFRPPDTDYELEFRGDEHRRRALRQPRSAPFAVSRTTARRPAAGETVAMAPPHRRSAPPEPPVFSPATAEGRATAPTCARTRETAAPRCAPLHRVDAATGTWPIRPASEPKRRGSFPRCLGALVRPP